jgi:hypothetical protein
MIDPIQDPLADRLRAIQLEPPRSLVPSVLAAAGMRRSRSVPQRFGLVAVPIVLVALLMGASSYFSPRFADALAGAPVIGGPIGELLRSTGMIRVQGRLTPLSDSVTSANFKVSLIGGYADAFQTLLIIRIDNPRQLHPSVLQQATLSDQFGRSYEQRAETWSTKHPGYVDEVISFAPLSWPASWAGARLTLSIDGLQLESSQPINVPPVAGHWILHGILDMQDTQSLSLPVDGRIGSTSFHFISLQTSPAALQLRMAIDGPLAPHLNDVGHLPEPYKPQPDLTIELVDAHGIAQRPLQGEMFINGEHVDLRWLWVVPSRGDYQLIVNFTGGGSFSREIHVPGA